MAKTIGFGKLEREMLSNDRLPVNVRTAIVAFKNQIKNDARLTPFYNREGLLPTAAIGQAYFEHQVGQAHPDDPEPRGRRRLVGLVNPSRNLLKLDFTDAHYTRGIWRQLQYA